MIPKIEDTNLVDVITFADRELLQKPVDEQKGVVDRVKLELETSLHDLQMQTETLEKERVESVRLTSRITELRQKSQELEAEARKLSDTRSTLAELSVRIHGCMRSVGGALSSATSISVMRSMCDVVAGLRGVIASLGQDAMFSESLAQLNDIAFATLNSHVTPGRNDMVTI